jgi:hypothetical protein
MNATPSRGAGPASVRFAPHVSESYRVNASTASHTDARRPLPWPWPRYHRIDGELLDIDAPITSLGFSLPEEGGAA